MALNPQILRWARDTAGLTVDEAAHALKFNDVRNRTAIERLRAMEAGKEEPSQSVLRNMARTYHRSLLVFYLNEPPPTGDRGQDFRRAPGARIPEYDPTLDALIRDIRSRQSVVKDLIEQTDPRRIDYIASALMRVPPVELAHRIMERLQFSLTEFRGRATPQLAFGYLRERVETSGAFVLLIGNLGSYHTSVSSDLFRGYAIADPMAPFIVVNDQDAPVAWAFTTLHELTHLWLGTTGVSGGDTDTQLETYCNSVAGEILLPVTEMSELGPLRQATFNETVKLVAEFARVRKVSRRMVAYGLLRANLIARARWQELEKHYKDEWIAIQARPTAKNKDDGGPNYYVVKRHRLGDGLLTLVKNSLTEGSLTYTKAALVLGVKPRNVDPLVSGMRGGR